MSRVTKQSDTKYCDNLRYKHPESWNLSNSELIEMYGDDRKYIEREPGVIRDPINAHTPMVERDPKQDYVSMETILEWVPVSRASIDNWVKKGQFPAPVRLSDCEYPRTSWWTVSQFQEWVDMLKSRRAG